LRSSRFLGLGAAAVLGAAVGGCTQLTPASVADFGAEKTVLVTMRDGETLKGHIDLGEKVTYTSIGRVYRAEIESLSDNGDMVLARPYLQEEYGEYALQRERMAESELEVPAEIDKIEIPAYKIEKVEEISFDRMKSARAAGFWGFTILVAASVLSARL